MTITITSDLFTPSPVTRTRRLTFAEYWGVRVAAETALYIRNWSAANPPQADPSPEWLDPQWVQQQIADIVAAFPPPAPTPAKYLPRCYVAGVERKDWPKDWPTFTCRYTEGHRGRHSWQRVGKARQLAAVGTEHAEDGT